MSDFLVSARKYRPTTFDAVVGQYSITSTLKNAIKSNQLAHSYLFCGPRGVGKTTCARIFAKEINQFNNDSDIDDFSFNIFELDAASNNSVDDIRNLTDQVRVPPQIGKYKVYIIDEVHMLSQSAFNAFLKTLEEPPQHAKFILATTEKYKIIPTILSRCQIFDFKRVGISDIASHLDFVAKSEGIVAEKDALHLIAQKADGAIRDSLSLFDRLISFSDKNLTYQKVIEHLNILDYDYYFKITDFLLKNEINQLLNIYNKILENGFDGHHFINGLSDHLRDLLVSKDVSTIQLLEKGDVLQSRYLEQSEKCELSFLLSALNLCNECDRQYKAANNSRLLVELTLMRISSIGFNIDQKKKDKSFVVSTNDEKRETDVNETIDKYEENIVPVVKNSTIDDSIKINIGKNKKPSLISINSLSEADVIKDESFSVNLRDMAFSESDLIKHWENLVVFMKNKGKSNLGIILALDKPKLLEDFVIEVSLSNSTQEEMIIEEKYLILEYLRGQLKNDMIDITTKIVDVAISNMPYTNKDKFKKMLAKNPQLETLRLELGLDPEY